MAFVASLETEGASIAAGATATLATASFTPAANELIVIKIATGDKGATVGTPTLSNGLTSILRISRGSTNNIANTTGDYIYTAQQANYATVAPGATTVSVTVKNNLTSASRAHLVVERWSGHYLAPSDTGQALLAAAVTASATAGYTIAFPQNVAASAITWTISDWKGLAATAQTATTGNVITQTIYATGPLVSFNGYMTTTGGPTSRTIGLASITSTASGTRSLMLVGLELPPGTPPVAVTTTLTETLTENFTTAPNTTRFPTQNGFSIDATYGCGALSASQVNGNPNYSALRSAAIYTFQGSWVVLHVPLMPQAPGEQVNFQFWITVDPGTGVNRIGFEYVAQANRLDFLGQTTGYASIGTTQSVLYSRAHQWLRLAMSGTTIIWQTSPDGFSWVTQRTLTGAPTWTTQNNLMISIECFRFTGNNTTALFDNLNLPATVAGTPRWIISTQSAGVVVWAAVETAADVVTADYQNADYNRQSAAGNGASSGLTWPVPIVPAPWGRSGARAALVRLPDNSRRNEIMPDVDEWGDGEMWWEGFSFALGADVDLNATGYQVIWQSRPDDDRGSPPCAIEVFKGAIKVTGGYNRPTAAYPTAPTSGGTYSYETTILANPQKQRWYNVVLCYGVWSAVNSGCFAVNIDGAWVHNANPVLPGTNYPWNGSKTYAKCGLYHDAANRGATIYISDHRIGTGFAAVDPSRPIISYGGMEYLIPRKL